MSPSGVALDDQNATVNAAVQSDVSDPTLFGVVNMLYCPGKAADVALGNCANSEYDQIGSPSTSALKGRAGTAVTHVITPAAATKSPLSHRASHRLPHTTKTSSTRPPVTLPAGRPSTRFRSRIRATSCIRVQALPPTSPSYTRRPRAMALAGPEAMTSRGCMRQPVPGWWHSKPATPAAASAVSALTAPTTSRLPAMSRQFKVATL